MKYLLLCCFNEKQWDAFPDSRRDRVMREYGELMESLHRSGHHLTTGKLKSVAAATTVRALNGKPAVVDGPYAETKEQLGGYHVLECKDLDEAIAIAKRIPTLPYGGALKCGRWSTPRAWGCTMPKLRVEGFSISTYGFGAGREQSLVFRK